MYSRINDKNKEEYLETFEISQTVEECYLKVPSDAEYVYFTLKKNENNDEGLTFYSYHIDDDYEDYYMILEDEIQDRSYLVKYIDTVVLKK